MARNTSPVKLAKEATAALKSLGNSRSAERALYYFKPHEPIRVYGVSTPVTRKLAGELLQRVRGQWSVDEAVEFCDILIRNRHLEAKFVGMLVLSRYKKEFSRDVIRRVEKWLAGDYCADWASTDALSTLVISELIRRFPDLVAKTRGWTRSRNLWLRRAAAVSLTPLARRGQLLDESYQVAESLFRYPEDLIHKATGWLLREAGKTDPARLERFLLESGPKIPRTALRYAIERFPAAKRKWILVSTQTKSIGG